MLGGLSYWRGEWDEALARVRRARAGARAAHRQLGAGRRSARSTSARSRSTAACSTRPPSSSRRRCTSWRAVGRRGRARPTPSATSARVAGRAGRYDEAFARCSGSRKRSRGPSVRSVDALEAQRCACAECLARVRVTSPRPSLVAGRRRSPEGARALGMASAAQSPLLHRVRGAAFAARRRSGRTPPKLALGGRPGRGPCSRSTGYEITLTARRSWPGTEARTGHQVAPSSSARRAGPRSTSSAS